MEAIKIDRFYHRKAHRIGIHFKYDDAKREHLKKLGGLVWSQTHSCFTLPDTPENIDRVVKHMEAGGFKVERPPKLEPELARDAAVAFQNYLTFLKGKRYSKSTIKTYGNFVKKFLVHNQKPIREITNRTFERFIEDVIAELNYSISTHRQCYSAFKLFAGLLELPELDVSKLEIPHKDRRLPVVLSEEEVIQLLVATRNLKHRMFLGLLYSSGLRIGELLTLKLEDIDLDRSQIFVRNSKGRKDRYVGMAESFKPLLINYLNTYQPRKLLVEGLKGDAYNASTVRYVLKQSCRRAGIRKRVSPHSLRHSYATHMLEHGVNLRYIQALLGHSRPETTMIYTQVVQTDVVQIRSPLDVAVERLAGDKLDKNLRLTRGDLL